LVAGIEVSAAAISSEKEDGRSACEPYRQVILEKLELGLSAQRIYQDLVPEGFDHEYHSVRRFVARLRRTSPLPFRRMECEMGEEAQVDFGSGAWIELPDGKRRRSHVFRIVLSFSRKGYCEAVYRQTAEDFIRCMENAFWHFGGVPKVLVIDNLKAAVEQPDWYDPDLTPKIQSFCEHYGVAILPTKPRTPRHKGKIESGVGYVQSNGLKGHRFTSLVAENEHLLRWETTLRKLRLSGLAQTLEVRLQEAVSHSLSHAEFLELILQDELSVRQQRLIERRVKAAGFRELKPLSDFEWSFNPSIKKKQIFDLACCRFIRERRDVLWMGPPGVGKSFLVQALAYEAIKQGFVVLYRSIFDVVRDFLHDEAFGGEERVLAKYLKPDLLIVDDMGMKQLPKRSGEYLFEIIMRRYETRSTMMTSNRPLEDWGKLIGDIPSATAILDRFLHHAEIITITGRSYRLRNRGGEADESKDNGQTSKEGKRPRREPTEPPPSE
jgi:DNA replication protein DnaC/transposase